MGNPILLRLRSGFLQGGAVQGLGFREFRELWELREFREFRELREF